MNKQATETETKSYRVFDEMAFEVLLLTNDLRQAHDTAYNAQAVLIDNITDKVIKDYSCDY